MGEARDEIRMRDETIGVSARPKAYLGEVPLAGAELAQRARSARDGAVQKVVLPAAVEAFVETLIARHDGWQRFREEAV